LKYFCSKLKGFATCVMCESFRNAKARFAHTISFKRPKINGNLSNLEPKLIASEKENNASLPPEAVGLL
jgi:hypothetical protein